MRKSLEQEVKMLRSFAVSIVGRDIEGAYRPEFVRKIARAAKRTPTRTFKNTKTFLAELARND